MTEVPKVEAMTAGRTGRRVGMLASVLALAAVVIGAILYGMTGITGKQAAAECAPAKAVAARVDPYAHGEVAAFSVAKPPDRLPPLSFTGPGGTKTTLADFKGRTVLLNIWATWCVPCRQEMPALDKLQAQLGSPDFQVVAVNIDTSRLDRPKQFLDQVGVKNLAFFADPSADLFQSLRAAGKVTGLPTSFLIDGRGCEIGTLAGGADWGSPDGLALIKAALGA
jgi:thiol-disulfide isomerase/thioredoxin